MLKELVLNVNMKLSAHVSIVTLRLLFIFMFMLFDILKGNGNIARD